MTETDVQADLASWLLACVDEDEQRIQAALARVRGWSKLNLPWLRVKRIEPALRQPDEMLLAVWDPDRLLLECDTRRRIIDTIFAYEATIDSEWGCGHSANEIRRGQCEATPVDEIPALRLLALPMAGREGYRQDLWAPDGR